MRDAVICEPLRTPVGGFGGSLRDVPAHTLAATVIRALMERHDIDWSKAIVTTTNTFQRCWT